MLISPDTRDSVDVMRNKFEVMPSFSSSILVSFGLFDENVCFGCGVVELLDGHVGEHRQIARNRPRGRPIRRVWSQSDE